jgi:hypothetical protein
MLNVVVELWPYGYKSGKKELADFQIANTGTGTFASGNYMVRFEKEDWSKDAVLNYRREEKDVLKLVYLALKSKYDPDK